MEEQLVTFQLNSSSLRPVVIQLLAVADLTIYQRPLIEDQSMGLILAILSPWLQFFTIGRPFAGVICLLLQLSLIGWIPAAIWSVYVLSQYKTDQKIKDAMGGK